MSDAMVLAASGSSRGDRSPVLDAVLPTAVFGLVLLWRAPDLLLHPRFWAEEGGLYFGTLQNVAPLTGLLRVFNGNYQLLTNVFVELSVHVPLRSAPAVTTMLSMGLALVCAWMIGRVLLARGCSLPVVSAACAMFALQPAGYEVFLTATNVQWVTSVIALMICLWEETPARSLGAGILYGSLVVCGLTGTTTCILLPLFVIGAVHRRSGFGWTMVAVLSGVTALQAVIVMTHRGEMQRAFAVSDQAMLPLVLQVVLSQFLPGDFIDSAGAMFKAQRNFQTVWGLQATLIGLSSIAVLSCAASKRVGTFVSGLLAVGAVSVSLVNEFGAQATADQMMSASAGARYFFAGATSFIILLAISGQTSSWAGRVCGWTMIALVLVNGVLTATQADWPRGNVTGPSFSEQVEACQGTSICDIKVWPEFYRPFLTVGHTR